MMFYNRQPEYMPRIPITITHLTRRNGWGAAIKIGRDAPCCTPICGQIKYNEPSSLRSREEKNIDADVQGSLFHRAHQ
jgi:hypothetical protein